jgi:hypothetical protein
MPRKVEFVTPNHQLSKGGIYTTKIEVIKGIVKVNRAIIYKKGRNVCAIIVDLNTKWGTVEAYGGDDGCPLICVGADEGTLHADRRFSKDHYTQIILKDFKGWNVFDAGITKYSLHICLTRGN